MTKPLWELRLLNDAMTQIELAKRSGYSVSTIKLFEREPSTMKRTDPNRLDKIAKALNVSVNDIYKGE